MGKQMQLFGIESLRRDKSRFAVMGPLLLVQYTLATSLLATSQFRKPSVRYSSYFPLIFQVTTIIIVSAPGTNATTNNDNGLLGVGPPNLSAIKEALDNTNFEEEGNTLIDNIFAVNTSLPQISTFSLSRSFATGSTDGGTYTIGEVNSTLSSVTNQPKLEVVSQSRWIVLLGGIVVNGKNFSGDSMLYVVRPQSDFSSSLLTKLTSLLFTITCS